MVLITLVGESQAKIGRSFVYLGMMPECGECRLKGICSNLDEGYAYRITALRPQSHHCLSTDDDVHVVEVEKIYTEALVQKKTAIEGSMITFQSIDCKQTGCSNYCLCHPIGIRNGDKRHLTEVGKKAECPTGENLVRARLE